MQTIIIEVDGWILAFALGLTMLASWALGSWSGRRRRASGRDPSGANLNDAIMALMGLLLAFTFSMSLSKHDQRRQMVVSESNSIGDFYTCASLIQEPVRSKLQQVLRSYVDRRLAVSREPLDEARLQVALHEAQQMHNQMQAHVSEALQHGSPIVVPLVNTLNEVTSSHAARLAAVRDRLPPSVILLLALTAILSAGLVGRQQGAEGERPTLATFGFILLVSMVVWVTLDLNQPRRGLIQVSQEPLERLLAGMSE